MSAGLAVGTAGLAVVAVVTVHCMHLLVGASQRLSKLHHTPYLDYGEVAAPGVHGLRWCS